MSEVNQLLAFDVIRGLTYLSAGIGTGLALSLAELTRRRDHASTSAFDATVQVGATFLGFCSLIALVDISKALAAAGEDQAFVDRAGVAIAFTCAMAAWLIGRKPLRQYFASDGSTNG